MKRSLLVLVVGLALSPIPAAAQSVDLEESLSAVEHGRVALPPLRLAQRASAAPIALAAAIEAAPDELADLATWNRERREPARIGFARPLPEALRVDLAAGAPDPVLRSGEAVAHAGGLLARTAAGELVWGARIEVADAHRLRLHLTEVALPPGTEMWVYGGDNEMVAFGLELLSEEERSLWTPSIGGGAIHLEVRAPAGPEGAAAGSFAVGDIAEIFRLDGEGRPLVGVTPAPNHDVSCLVDAQCIGPGTFDVIEPVQRSIAHLQFMVGSAVGICTGGLVNDTVAGTTVPFLQTANHCLSTQTVANTIEAFWDYFTPTCGGLFPSLGSLPRSSGSRLLATGQSSDFTLLRLNTIPPNRVLLGWNADPLAVPHGAVLHRVSHPHGFAQAYSRTAVTTTAGICSTLPRPRFLYQNTTLGGTLGGSSGAPVIRAGGQMVGQLLGVCGTNPSEGCDIAANRIVDGAFSESFRFEGPFLTGSGFSPCVSSPTSLCLHNNRFRVEVEWETASNEGNGVVLSKLSDASGVFYFFNPNNAEMLVKVLNACVAPFNRYWVFFAATTNVEFTVKVTDTLADVTKSFYNPPNRAALPIQDTEAFATCP